MWSDINTRLIVSSTYFTERKEACLASQGYLMVAHASSTGSWYLDHKAKIIYYAVGDKLS